MKRMLLISGKTSEDAQASPQYAAAIDGLINFWNHSSDFTKGDIQNYIQNKCGLSLQEGISSDSDGLHPMGRHLPLRPAAELTPTEKPGTNL